MWDDKPPQDHMPKEEYIIVDIITARQEVGKLFYEYRYSEILGAVL